MEIPNKCWWTFLQLVEWFRGKMVITSQKEDRIGREGDYGRYFTAFYIGLKLFEHWNILKNSSAVWSIAEMINDKCPPLCSLYKFTQIHLKRFSEEFVQSLNAAGERSEKTNERIKDYSNQRNIRSSFNSSMSAEGKQVLKKIYYFITDELEKGDPRGGLRRTIVGPRGISKAELEKK